MTTRTEVAYIYPSPYWDISEHDWVKSLLLFFDEVSILLPDYMYGRHQQADPSLAGPLEDRGLLTILEPKVWIDEPARLELVTTMNGFIDGGAFDGLTADVHFQELSQSRAGYGVNIDVADDLIQRLIELGLARSTEDGVSIPLHPVVRSTMLVLLGQFARGIGDRVGHSVHPTTSNRRGVVDLRRFLLTEQLTNAGTVIDLELENVGLNLGPVPLDELLDFRSERLGEHKTYMTNLRGFMAELSDIGDAAEREQHLLERREEIADEARRLQRRHDLTSAEISDRSALALPATWSIATGDPIGAVLGAGSACARTRFGHRHRWRLQLPLQH
ncbi:MAG: hypothetical protein WKF58_00750 [Ilumatobacteraceae bacterium]